MTTKVRKGISASTEGDNFASPFVQSRERQHNPVGKQTLPKPHVEADSLR